MTLKLRLVTPTAVHKFIEVSKLRDLLSPKELLVFKKLKSERRKWDWLAGRLAAKELLRDHLAQALGGLVSLGQIELYHGPAGAPCFRLLNPELKLKTLSHTLNISMAHSHGYGLCGLAHTEEDGYVGVDLERIRPLSPGVQRRFLTQAEMKQIKQQFAGVECEGAVLFWALKEAAFKALHLTRKLASLQVMRNTGISLEAGGKAVVAISNVGAYGHTPLLNAAYRRHADFFIVCTLSRLHVGTMRLRPCR